LVYGIIPSPQPTIIEFKRYVILRKFESVVV
jgi:hypothetical protein